MHFKALKSQALQPDLLSNTLQKVCYQYTMGRLSDYGRTRVIHLHRQNYSSKQIAQALKEENIITTSRAVQRLIKKFNSTGTTKNLKKSGRPAKVSVIFRLV